MIARNDQFNMTDRGVAPAMVPAKASFNGTEFIPNLYVNCQSSRLQSLPESSRAPDEAELEPEKSLAGRVSDGDK